MLQLENLEDLIKKLSSSSQHDRYIAVSDISTLAQRGEGISSAFDALIIALYDKYEVVAKLAAVAFSTAAEKGYELPREIISRLFIALGNSNVRAFVLDALIAALKNDRSRESIMMCMSEKLISIDPRDRECASLLLREAASKSHDISGMLDNLSFGDFAVDSIQIKNNLFRAFSIYYAKEGHLSKLNNLLEGIFSDQDEFSSVRFCYDILKDFYIAKAVANLLFSHDRMIIFNTLNFFSEFIGNSSSLEDLDKVRRCLVESFEERRLDAKTSRPHFVKLIQIINARKNELINFDIQLDKKHFRKPSGSTGESYRKRSLAA